MKGVSTIHVEKKYSFPNYKFMLIESPSKGNGTFSQLKIEHFFKEFEEKKEEEGKDGKEGENTKKKDLKPEDITYTEEVHVFGI